MEEANATLKFVLAILAIGTAVGPLIFGFALWRMSQVFVTKEQFADWKTQAHDERTSMNRRLEVIEKNTTTLLQRTARAAGKEHDE